MKRNENTRTHLYIYTQIHAPKMEGKISLKSLCPSAATIAVCVCLCISASYTLCPCCFSLRIGCSMFAFWCMLSHQATAGCTLFLSFICSLILRVSIFILPPSILSSPSSSSPPSSSSTWHSLIAAQCHHIATATFMFSTISWLSLSFFRFFSHTSIRSFDNHSNNFKSTTKNLQWLTVACKQATKCNYNYYGLNCVHV